MIHSYSDARLFQRKIIIWKNARLLQQLCWNPIVVGRDTCFHPSLIRQRNLPVVIGLDPRTFGLFQCRIFKERLVTAPTLFYKRRSTISSCRRGDANEIKFITGAVISDRNKYTVNGSILTNFCKKLSFPSNVSLNHCNY